MRMQQYQHQRLQNQKGVAAIWMGLLLIPIMGFTFWAVEGTRYVQETSRLRDSAEAAAIAVTIEDQPGAARDLAMKYVKSYVRDIKSMNLSAERFKQEGDNKAGILEYVQYTINARTTHDSWFASSLIPSFDKQQSLAGRSLARKYPANLRDTNIDIVFVSDFSGSMDMPWGGSQSKKIDGLKSAISQISSKILCTSPSQDYVNGEWKEVCDESGEQITSDKLLNRVGFVPYNIRTRELVGGNEARVTSQLSYKRNYNAYLSSYNYNNIDWDAWRIHSLDYMYNCAANPAACFPQNMQLHEQAKRIKDVINQSMLDPAVPFANIIDVYNYVDFYASVSTMFTDKSALKSNYYRASNTALFAAHGFNDPTQFYNIPLSNKLSDLNAINRMRAEGGTAAFQGILRGIQILRDGAPNSYDQDEQQAYQKKIKMLLILSDGQEDPKTNILKGLVDAGMCNRARAAIPGLYIGIIGVDFLASQQSGFQDCVVNPSQDIIDVSNVDELIEKIEELIRKSSKTSGITKLY